MRALHDAGRVTSHLFLDLDGTVTDPRDGIVRCISHALATLKRPTPADHTLERFIGPPLPRVFETLLGTTDEVLVSAAIKAYRDRFSSIGLLENRVYPEIPSALSVLTGRGVTLYLVTSKPTVFARRILDHFGLSTYFTRIYGPDLDDMKYSKASLVGRALATERLAPGAVTMIGDRREDIEGAKANRVRSIGVTWGYGSREELEAAGADHVVSSVPELLVALGAVASRRSAAPAARGLPIVELREGVLFATFAIAAGVATSIQATTNAGRSKSVGLGPALVVNTVVVLFGAVSLWLATGARTTFFPAGTAWTLYLGGLFGFTIIAAGAFVFPKLGAAWAVALMLFGQSVAALVIDHYGLMGMERAAMTPQRLIGAGLVVAGVAIFRL